VTRRERAAALQAIADEIAVCQRCRLHEGRTRAVPGEGHPSTEVAFVGEGPGFNEDQQGRPFVGAAGQVLAELLRGMDWRREEVFITNVVKCRPPGNRDPEPDEIAACAPFLRRQLEALDPALIVTLGRHSLDSFRPGARISQAHGTVMPAPASSGANGALHLALYHPAAALRSTAIKETLAAEAATIPATLEQARARRRATLPQAGDEAAQPAEAGVPNDPGLAEVATATATAGAADPSDDQMGLFR
jgi:DNA polymerase